MSEMRARENRQANAPVEPEEFTRRGGRDRTVVPCWVEDRLAFWGQWMRSRETGGLGFKNSPLARMASVSARAEAGSVVPYDEIEASQTDEAVRSLVPELQRFAYAWWYREMTVRSAARYLGCSTTTIASRREQVVLSIKVWFRNRSERRAAAGSAG